MSSAPRLRTRWIVPVLLFLGGKNHSLIGARAKSFAKSRSNDSSSIWDTNFVEDDNMSHIQDFKHQQNRHLEELEDDDVCEYWYGRYGPCDVTRFPTCDRDEKLCFIRRPSSHLFVNGNRRDPGTSHHYLALFLYRIDLQGAALASKLKT
jgi:hypothetical protein